MIIEVSDSQKGPVRLAELCCGGAAVTLAAIRGDGERSRTLVSYMGNKRRYAPQILGAMGIAGREIEAVLLCDSGPWGLVWKALTKPGAFDAVRSRILEFEGQHSRPLFDALIAAGVPTDPTDFVAAYLLLQSGNAAARPVGVSGVDWVTHGYKEPKDLQRRVVPRMAAGRVTRASVEWPKEVEVFHGCVSDAPVEAFRPTHVYMDPPYAGTTGYGDDLPDKFIETIVGLDGLNGLESIGVSEGRDLGPPWRAVDISNVGKENRTFTRSKREILNLVTSR